MTTSGHDDARPSCRPADPGKQLWTARETKADVNRQPRRRRREAPSRDRFALDRGVMNSPRPLRAIMCCSRQTAAVGHGRLLAAGLRGRAALVERRMSFDRAWILVVLAADAIWLAALAGRQFGVPSSICSAAQLVTAVLLIAVLCALAGRLVWGRVRRTARQKAWRATALAEKARPDGERAAGTLAWQAMAATGSVGCAAVIVSASRGSPALRSAYSAAGRSGRRGHALGPDTRFEIGSLTKIFTGLILADMAVRKEVDLDTPLGSLLDIPAARAVTLRSLATHTAGLPRGYTGPGLAPLRTAHPNPYRNIGLDHVGAALARKPPEVPGTFRYSNLGYQLLAAALAAAAGTTWPCLLQQRICVPLGMTKTGMDPDNNTARGHDKAGFPFPYSDYALLPGAIGLLSTTADLGTFLQAQLQPWSTPLWPAIRLSRTSQAGPPHAAGLGWRLSISSATTLAWHGGLTSGFSALLAVLDTPRGPRGLAILTNSPYDDALLEVGLKALSSAQLRLSIAATRKKAP
jgi:serine-type D-Ala-D-Ala carboxypeptidase/endopeptidase